MVCSFRVARDARFPVTVDVEALQEENLKLLEELETAYGQLERLLIDEEAEKEVIYAELRQKMERYRALFVGTLHALVSAIDAKDPYTRGHSARVSDYCEMVGSCLHLTLEQREQLQYAGLFHDVGKIGIDERILQKPRCLDAGEWTVVHRHPIVGAAIIEPIELFRDTVLPMVLHHHERFDGSGYPDGLQGSNIPFGARIVAVADAIDTMATDRPYRTALTRELILDELGRCAGTHFDPEIAATVARSLRDGAIVLVLPADRGN